MSPLRQFDGANFSDPYQAMLLSQAQKQSQKDIEPLDYDHTEEGEVLVFNIGPNQHQNPLGGLGTFTIPACPKDRAYSAPLRIWKKTPEGRHEDMQKMSLRICDGHAIAESVVGYGKFMGGNADSMFSTDLRNFGVFTCGAFVTMELEDGKRETILASERVAFLKRCRIDNVKARVIQGREVTAVAIKAARKNGDKRSDEEIGQDILNAMLPTEAELDEAYRTMNKFCLKLVEVGNAFYRENNLREINSLMRWAATVTGNTGLPWVAGSLLMTKCEACGNSLAPDVAICLGCKGVVTGKEHVVIAKELPGYEYLWDPTHPRYRGHKFGGPPPAGEEEAEPVARRTRRQQPTGA